MLHISGRVCRVDHVRRHLGDKCSHRMPPQPCRHRPLGLKAEVFFHVLSRRISLIYQPFYEHANRFPKGPEPGRSSCTATPRQTRLLPARRNPQALRWLDMPRARTLYSQVLVRVGVFLHNHGQVWDRAASRAGILGTGLCSYEERNPSMLPAKEGGGVPGED